MRVAIIGGGPAGLVTLKYLLQAQSQFETDDIEAVIFEAEEAIGGTFRYRSYERAELVSSRQLTAFTDFRIPDDLSDFVTTERYCSYLEDYCSYFKLWPHIRLSTTVKRVLRDEKNGHSIHFQEKGSDAEQIWHCDAIAVCSGLHVTPNIPQLSGVEKVSYTLHSSEFKKCSQFGVNTNVLILGAGETAMDLAYLAVNSPTKSVTLCHRNGWQNAPKRFPDPIRDGNVEFWTERFNKYGFMPPTDTGSPSLFDTAYVHPWVERSGLLWEYYDRFTKYSSWVISGTTAGVNQWVGGIQPERHHARRVIPNKSNNAMPYISAPYKPKVPTKGQWKRAQILSLPPIDLKDRQIDLAPWLGYFDEKGYVHFQETDRPESESMKHAELKPDVVIFATGYTQVFPFLDHSYPRPETADIRRIWNSSQPDIGFIGFVRPNFGAIPPLAELQAQLWILKLLNRLPNPLSNDTSYRLHTPPDRRIQYAVDHDSYAYRLALDTSSAPSISQILYLSLTHRSPQILYTYALGPNFTTKFRLVGPWKTDVAPKIMAGELWNVIARRRGWFVWTFLTIIPMTVFGTLSLSCYIIDSILQMSIVGFLWRVWKRGAGVSLDQKQKSSN